MDRKILDELNELTSYENYKYVIAIISYNDFSGSFYDLDDYTSLNSQIKFLSDEYKQIPFCITIPDLELVLNYIHEPEKFIEYITTRIKFNKKIIIEKESDFLGFYLENGFEGVDESKYGIIYIEKNFSNSIDADFYNKLLNNQQKNLI
ncbi:MAG: hypothetical protein A2086_06430 [Spirochaetes bacterium GWD1_27_9]|nr:MAG: hypothetical protein A2Z98_01970 [Spirochaetes bacterium GWB1_27_13]OHD36503.1 MAG: hypothetical protein A2086_06430 [Spirochaetes bacterium GWD1_27_9]